MMALAPALVRVVAHGGVFLLAVTGVHGGVLLAGHVIVNVVASAFFAAVEPVSLSHNCIHSDEFTTVDLDSGREQVGVTQGRPELNPAGTSAGTRLWKFPKPYSSNWLGLEAEVGIGLLMPCFPKNLKPLSEQFQYNPALFGLTRFNSLTEGFTERDMRSLEQLFVM